MDSSPHHDLSEVVNDPFETLAVSLFAFACVCGVLWLVLALVALVAYLRRSTYVRTREYVRGKRKDDSTSSLRVTFVHLDLGIGGQERLLVDAAVELQRRGHSVRVFTTHHDRTHCFEETRDGTLEVHAHGDWLPRQPFGRFQAVCALIRMLYLSLVVVLASPHADVLFVDGVSTGVPLLRFFAPVLFYCHFPDKLLVRASGRIQSLYRLPLDMIEEVTTASSDQLAVNSGFTAEVFSRVFRSIKRVPSVLYPPVDTGTIRASRGDRRGTNRYLEKQWNIPKNVRLIVSINRFHPVKSIDVLIRAYRLGLDSQGWSDTQLVLAGGYDDESAENVEYYAEITKLTDELGLTRTEIDTGAERANWDVNADVVFCRNISQEQKLGFFDRAEFLVYTPANEHFGIVPIEAMLHLCPVLAANSGGPLESVTESGENGILVDSTPDGFAEGLIEMLDAETDLVQMGRNGRKRVLENFSLTAFGENLESLLQQAAG